ncbi:hypothetical protein N8I77_001803 [Diaporthe amygdali]|uniref:Plasma membrane proteolipid 3 n=1 Tax=Phomopsis amygdali TaxID=1214568 RepID=A0AAD9SSS6_PHOAM|nr:hypothetical protein N8I77_001803 [Diaporthe amygdali]
MIDICKIILAIFLPPLGVFFERGCGADLLINILLTILGYIPGIIHALYVTERFVSNTPRDLKASINERHFRKYKRDAHDNSNFSSKSQRLVTAMCPTISNRRLAVSGAGRFTSQF